MTSWLVWTFRGRRLDHNPLWRPSDRAETAAVMVLVVAFAVAAPFTMRAAAGVTYAFTQHVRGHRDGHAARGHRGHATDGAFAEQYPVQSWVSATWTASDGRQRTGQVQVDDGTLKGSAERIWVTGSGDVAPTAKGRAP